MKSIYSLGLFVCAFSIFLNGCSVLVGQVKPVEEKAPKVPFTDVTQIAPTWKRLDIPAKTKSKDDIPDAAWQSGTTAAVISLNSACRQTPDEDRTDLKEVTRIILSQWDNLSIISETPRTLSGLEAWETVAEGKYLGRQRKFETAVVKTPTCVYDMVYLSPVKTFTEELSVFERFRDSLNLK
jgi:hypothetical protein